MNRAAVSVPLLKLLDKIPLSAVPHFIFAALHTLFSHTPPAVFSIVDVVKAACQMHYTMQSEIYIQKECTDDGRTHTHIIYYTLSE